MPNILKEKIKNNWKELTVISLLLIISAVAHGYNMLHFPYYENDEGVYESQAWSLITQGKLAPYTYWYDHAPGGWILIAIWTLLTRGFFTFGLSVNSGRVLMLLLHLLSVFLLYKTVKNLLNSSVAGIIVIIFFSLSPLGIYFQRRVLLDNIMIFWVLFSLFLLTLSKVKLHQVALSGFFFALAILSKENAIFFIPGMLSVLFLRVKSFHKMFAFGLWFGTMCLCVSLYFLYAILKEELFPAHTLFGGIHDHVSLTGTLVQQYARGGGAPLTDVNKNLFWVSLKKWNSSDSVIITFGIVSTTINSIIGVSRKLFRVFSLLSLGFWMFLIRGGVVIEFYIIPLLPILALNIAASIWWMGETLGEIVHKKFIYYTVTIISLTAIALVYFYQKGAIQGYNLYTSEQTNPQIEALAWMKSHLKPNSFIVIDNYGYVDLHDPSVNNVKFTYAEWYWKVDRDPEIALDILHNDPSNIGYIGLTPQMENDMRNSNFRLLSEASHNSKPIKRFWHDGWGVEFWQTRYPKQLLFLAWDSYKQHFLIDGKTIDPYQNNLTTSEGQSYTMLRSVWMNDKQEFDESWFWTKTHMQLSNGLFRWKVQENAQATEKSTATDADEDIALALAFAYRKWNDMAYLNESKKIITGIWNEDIRYINEYPYVTAGNWNKNNDTIVFNPSYFSPYSYRVFAQIDILHPWSDVIDTSYVALSLCSRENLDKTVSAGLAPNWCAVNTHGQIVNLPDGVNNTNYSYDAFRSTWRIALDYVWNNDRRAKDYLESSDFLRNEWNKKKKLLVGYTHDGKGNDTYEAAEAYAANIGNFLITDPAAATEIYQKHILAKFYMNEKESYWDDPKNYYEQNWAWFGTALYYNELPNYWTTQGRGGLYTVMKNKTP